MKKFSEWRENHSLGVVKNQVAADKSNLGASGFEGLQDIVDALKIVAQNNPNVAKGLIGGLAGKLAMMTHESDPELAKRLRSGASRFVGAASRMGGNPTPEQGI